MPATIAVGDALAARAELAAARTGFAVGFNAGFTTACAAGSCRAPATAAAARIGGVCGCAGPRGAAGCADAAADCGLGATAAGVACRAADAGRAGAAGAATGGRSEAGLCCEAVDIKPCCEAASRGAGCGATAGAAGGRGAGAARAQPRGARVTPSVLLFCWRTRVSSALGWAQACGLPLPGDAGGVPTGLGTQSLSAKLIPLSLRLKGVGAGAAGRGNDDAAAAAARWLLSRLDRLDIDSSILFCQLPLAALGAGAGVAVARAKRASWAWKELRSASRRLRSVFSLCKSARGKHPVENAHLSGHATAACLPRGANARGRPARPGQGSKWVAKVTRRAEGQGRTLGAREQGLHCELLGFVSGCLAVLSQRSAALA